MLYILIVGSLFAVIVEPACNVPNGMNESSANFIIAGHNTLRSLIAKGIYSIKDTKLPSATNMRKLEWSCDLQKQAQEIVDKRGDRQDACITDYAGSNIAIGYSRNYKYSEEVAAITRTLQDWEDEVFKGGWQLLNSSQSLSDGTQMVWWSSNKIGCAFKNCIIDSSTMKVCKNPEICSRAYLFICVYSPSGNVRGEAAYAFGTPCSNCGDGLKCEATSKLCIPA